MSEVKKLLAIGKRMKKEQLSKKQLLLSDLKVNVEDSEVESLPRLIYNHTLTKTSLIKESPHGASVFAQKLEQALKDGVITEPVYHYNRHLFTRHDIAALWEHWGIEKYRDNYEPCAIAVENQKGGTGKSTTTGTLGTGMALDIQLNARVLILELDPQGTNGQGMINHMAVGKDTVYLTPVDLILGEYEEDSDYQDLRNQGFTREEIIANAPFNTHLPNLDVMPAFGTDERFLHTFWQADDEMKDQLISELRTSIMPVLKEKYDFILIDTPPQESPLVWVVNDAIDALLIPITPQEYDYASTVNYSITTGERFGDLPNGGENLKWVRYLVVNHDEKSNSELKTINKLARTVQDRLLSTQIPHSELISYASSINRTALDVSKAEVKENKICSAKRYDEAILNINQVVKQIVREIKNISHKAV